MRRSSQSHQPEQSAYNGHFESTCYYPLLLFNGEGDCLGAKLRPGNLHRAEDWDEMLPPEIERQQELGRKVVFPADAAFAKPEIYEELEDRGVKCAILPPANAGLGPLVALPMKIVSHYRRTAGGVYDHAVFFEPKRRFRFKPLPAWGQSPGLRPSTRPAGSYAWPTVL